MHLDGVAQVFQLITGRDPDELACKSPDDLQICFNKTDSVWLSAASEREAFQNASE